MASAGEVKRGRAKTCSRNCYYNRLRRIVPKGENHRNWKTTDYGYSALHRWVSKQLGTPKICSNCGTDKARLYDWSNISGNYLRDVTDWQRLCRKCHVKFDGGNPYLRKGSQTWQRTGKI